MSIDLTQDFFTLFGLPRRYALEDAALEAAWHTLQSQVHPDRHAHLSDVEKRRAMQWATRVNEGFRTLRQPLARAQYLLELAGVDACLGTNTAMSPEFLMEQMEWREAVMEARSGGDHHELEHLYQRLDTDLRSRYDEVGELLDVQHDYALATDRVRRLMFLEKLLHEIDDALASLDD